MLSKYNYNVRTIQYEAKPSCKNADYSIINVVQSRVNDKKHFPNTICDVVFQKNYHKNGKPYCEFSFNKIVNGKCVPRKHSLNKDVLELAKLVHNVKLRDYTKGALYYHATYVRKSKSRWFRSKLHRTALICGHIFYK